MLFSISAQRSGSTSAVFVGQRLSDSFCKPLDDDLLLDRFLLQPLLDRRLQAEDGVDALLQAGDIPLLGVGARRAVRHDDRRDGVGAHFGNRLADAFGIHDVGALLVDDLALVVHHVVEFDDLLADVVVARLDLLLGGLDRLEIHGLTIASPSARFLFISLANIVCGPKMRSRSSSRLR